MLPTGEFQVAIDIPISLQGDQGGPGFIQMTDIREKLPEIVSISSVQECRR